MTAYDRIMNPHLWPDTPKPGQPSGKRRSFRAGGSVTATELARNPRVSASPEALAFWFGSDS